MNNDIDLTTLSELVDMPVRKVRFYIQKGLVTPPTGAKKNAKYSSIQVEQLLSIRKWQSAGLSLDRIQKILHSDHTDELLPPISAPTAGQISVISHIYLAPGISLQINPQESGLTTDQVRQLVQETLTSLTMLQKEKEDDNQ